MNSKDLKALLPYALALVGLAILTTAMLALAGHINPITVADGKIRFSVEDEGKGIKESEREKVFQKFYRADENTKGFGMGLAIVRGIVEAHDGKIWIEDGAVGSRFVFDLPLKLDE